MGLGILQQSALISVSITLHIYLWLHKKTGMLLCVLSMHMTSGMEQVLIMLVLYLSDRFHMGQQLVVLSCFVAILTSFTCGYYPLIETIFGIVLFTNKNEWVVQVDSFNHTWN